MTTTQRVRRRFKCPECGKDCSVRRNGTLILHGYNKYNPYTRRYCDGSERQVMPSLETALVIQGTAFSLSPKAEKAYRALIAEEIRGMVPPPWTSNPDAKAKAKEWFEVADFVERSGDWEGWKSDNDSSI